MDFCENQRTFAMKSPPWGKRTQSRKESKSRVENGIFMLV